mgnify:CR=1 FL=1
MVAETSQTLDRGLTVLEVLAESADGLTVTELAARLGVSRTVVYRLVVTLEQHALLRRGPEYDLLPWCRKRGLPLMAYTPLGQGALLRDPALARVGRRHGATPAQVALAWLMAQPGVTAPIASATSVQQLSELTPAMRLTLTKEQLARLTDSGA